MSVPKLSVLITAYNQSELLRWNIGMLLQNASSDFEIVIQDDGSEENLEELVHSFRDARLVYKRNPVNLGHDRSTVEGFRNCRSEYVFLLRSSDTILPGKIGAVLALIDRYPQLGYARFSCLDEEGKTRIQYADQYFEGTEQTIPLNRDILLHPSGELYNLRYLSGKDLAALADYPARFFRDRRGYVINELLRDLLCMRAPFVLSKEIVWQYTRTAGRTDLAVARNRNGVCVYDPAYSRERLLCEMAYIANEVPGDLSDKKELMRQIFAFYAKFSILTFRKINKDPDMQRHYGYRERPFSSLQELRIFKRTTKARAEELPEEYRTLLAQMSRKLSIYTIFYWYCQDHFPGTARGLQKWLHQKN